MAISRGPNWCRKNRMSTQTTTAIIATTISATAADLPTALFYSRGLPGQGQPGSAARSSTTKSVDAAAATSTRGWPGRPGCRPRDYLAFRLRKPKPSERVRVAVNVSNSTGVGYGPEPDQAEVW